MIVFKNKNNFYKMIFIFITFIIQFSCSQYPYIFSSEATIIVYHDIVDNSSSYKPEDNVRSLKTFENDLNYISSKFNVISLDELKEHVNKQKRLDHHSVIVTFDDKIPCDEAFNLLKKYSLQVTFFLATGKIEDDSWNKIRDYYNYTTKENNKLFCFESHTHNHVNLSGVSDSELYNELMNSKEMIKSKLGYPARYLALPWALGTGNQKIIYAAKKLGYKGIRTLISMSEDISSTDMYALKAFNIQNSTDIKSIIY